MQYKMNTVLLVDSLFLAANVLLAIESPYGINLTRPPYFSASLAASFAFHLLSTPSATIQTLSRIPSPPDYTLLVAFIGVGGAIVVAIITGIFAVYQIHLKAKLQKKMEIERHEHAQELLLLQKGTSRQWNTHEAGHYHQEANAQTTRIAMRNAQNLSEYIDAYRTALRTDPNIASLKILDMPSPMSVTSVYVRLRLHQEARASFVLESMLSEAEAKHDPHELLQASQICLENRFHNALEPDEAIRRYKRCIILGDPGAGKTTLLKNLALRSVDHQLKGLPDFPIHLELNTFATSGYQNLIDFAVSRWEERYGFPKSVARELIIKSLKAGTALFLLDALDEAVIGETTSIAEKCYRRVSEEIMQITTRYPQVPIVVTARKAGYQQRAVLGGFTELVVLDFRPQDIRQFVNNWFACQREPQKRKSALELNNKLERNPRIQALAANPLLLSLIVILYEARLDLPDRRAELYKQCVDTLLTKWDASRNIRRRREFKPEYKHLLLEEVAWYFHNRGQRYFKENELLTVITDFLPAIGLSQGQSQHILAEIANENGLIKEQARGWHGFLHLTLQEYFVAQHVTDRNQLGLLLAHWGEPWWEEVILLFAGHTPDASLLLKMLIGQDAQHPLQRDIFYSNVILAGRCLAARPVIRQSSLRNQVIDLLMRILETTPFSLSRKHIADVLVEVGGKEINTRLLGMFEKQRANPALLMSIVSAWSRFGDRSLAQDLFALLNNPFLKLEVRLALADALGKMGDDATIFTLLQMLTNTQIHLHLKERIALSLGEQGNATIIPQLLSLLDARQLAPSLRGAIAHALGKLGDRSTVGALLKLVSENQLDSDIRCRATEALGMLEDPSTVTHLLKLLAKTQPSKLRTSAALALSKVGDRSIVPTLFNLLDTGQDEMEVLLSIIHAIGTIGEQDNAQQILPLIARPSIDLQVRRALIHTAAILGGQSISPKLLQIVTSYQIPPVLELAIIDVLALVGNRSVVPTLTQMLTRPSNSIDMSVHIRCTLMRLNKNQTSLELLHLFRDMTSKLKLTLQTHEYHLLLHIVDTFNQMGEPSIILYLLGLISNQQIPRITRLKFINTIGQLANDSSTIHELVLELNTSDLADAIHQALWSISRRMGVVIPSGEIVSIAKTPSPSTNRYDGTKEQNRAIR